MKNTMAFKGYTASVEYDADDRILVGRVLHIDDIVSFHGASVAELEKAFKESVIDYIAACEALGQVPDKPASGKMMLRVNPQVHAAALKAASQMHLSLNKWAERVLHQAAHA